MGTIKVRGLAGSASIGEDYNEFTDLRALNGVSCHDEFVEYMDEPLKSKLESGYMSFVFEDEKLYTETVYTSKEVLTEEELQKLGEYTQGQWSDGIGEGFEQQPCSYVDDQEVFLSPWYGGQVLTITQY